MNVLAGMADILVLVVRAGSTPRDAVQQSLNRLKAVGEVGIILTGIGLNDMPYYARGTYYEKSGTPT